ncbi:site-specific integrase [Streptomyces spongiicola]|uniref:tyrosine-type recombinase/integrase n=1 Tax=Streptomyces spongiicola TaxID=1690221 RepID=UPI0033C5A94B
MAGHIQDRWFKTKTDAEGKPVLNGKGKPVQERTDRYGKGMRYRARYIGPDGSEKSQSFPDGQKRLAEDWLTNVKKDMADGTYADPGAAKKTFGQYAEEWLSSQGGEVTTRESTRTCIRKHSIPYLGSRPLNSFRPQHIRAWLAELEKNVESSSYRAAIFRCVSTVLSAAVDDGYMRTNPCRARSVRAPRARSGRVRPWLPETARLVRKGLPERYQAMVDLAGGAGMRQGEVFGLAVEDIDAEGGWVHVRCQVKQAGSTLMFGPPKGGKERDIPLSEGLGERLAEHCRRFPPQPVTLPWQTPDGAEVTRKLVFLRDGKPLAVHRNVFNASVWKPALVGAGLLLDEKDEWGRYPAAREHGMHALRHMYASVLLDAGENIKALASYLGHHDPALTLRIYAHLMPSSEHRARRAVDGAVFGSHGPETAQSPEGSSGDVAE